MKLIDRQIYAELLGPFIFGVAAFTSIMFAGSYLLRLTTDIVKGLPVSAALKIFVLYLPGVVVITLPMATLLAVLLGFSRMSSENEITAIFAGGISFYRVMLPVIIFGIAITGLTIFMNEFLVPKANLASERLREDILKQPVTKNKPLFLIDRNEDVTNVVVYVQGGYNSSERVLKKVLITVFRENKPRIVFRAEKAKWEGGENWSLSNGYWHILSDGNGGQSGSFDKWSTRVVNLGMTPEEVAFSQRSADQMTFKEMRRFAKDLALRGIDTAELEVSLYNKLSLPMAALMFALIGAPLGLRRHRGGSSVGLGLSIVIIILYWMAWHYMVALAKTGHIHPIIGAFTADFAGLLLGAGLIVRASK